MSRPDPKGVVVWVVWVLVIVCGCAEGKQAWKLDSFLGRTIFETDATGYFRVEQRNRTWWIITPEGHPFFSTGVNAVHPYGYYVKALGYSPYREAVKSKYGDEDAWASATLQRLLSWNFNTLGAWSAYDLFNKVGIHSPSVDELEEQAYSTPATFRMPYTVILYTSGASWLRGTIVDFFSQEFRDHAYKVAESYCKPLSTDPYLLGYFLDNEMRWGVDWRGAKTFFQEYFSLPATAPGKQKLVSFLRSRYRNDVNSLNSAWCVSVNDFDDLLSMTELQGCRPETPEAKEDRSEFLYLAAGEYFRVSAEAIHAYDPNHLILGARIQALVAPPEVVRACGEHSDVVSINFYELEGLLEEYIQRAGEAFGYPSGYLSAEDNFRLFYEITGKPILISEFGYRAADSGLPNSYPPGFLTLPNQYERAAAFERFAVRVASAPWIVGYHWFSWVDEPEEGRFDGEDSNWGIVNEDDEPYLPLVDKMTEVNNSVWEIHKDH